MLLSEIVADAGNLESSAPSAVQVTGITHDSRFVKPGDLFVCLVGAKFNGHRYAADALARGAAAFVVQRGEDPGIASAAPLVIAENTRKSLPSIAAAFYGHPSRKMKLVGVTGTNGKTTTTRLIASILRAQGLCSGTIGTLGSELMGKPFPSEHTTPEADQLQGILASMLDQGAQAITMEASSHALDQDRTGGCEFDAGVFTNLTQDHLDYHQTMDSYRNAKLKLFRDYPAASSKPFVAAINLDDPSGGLFAKETAGRTVTYSIRHAADIVARDIALSAERVQFTATTPQGDFDFELSIGGAFQVYNALAAIATGIGLGVSPETIAQGLKAVENVPGRFEAVPNDRGFGVIVDYAHTPDGLANLIQAARKLNPRRIILVFGCGGDRDKTKRPLMGRLGANHTEIAIVTSDNPRTEDPNLIIEDILSGMDGASAKVEVEADRRAAIMSAIEQAVEGDIVLIAGKGHEDYQIVGTQVLAFDDRQVARECLAELEGAR